MFDIGWGEMVVIGTVALVVIRPKELPGVLRAAGHWVGKARRMADDFRNQFQEALREADIAEMKKQFDDAANAASQMTASPNLLGSVKQDVEDAFKIDPPPATAASESSAQLSPPGEIASERVPAESEKIEPVAAPAGDKPS